MLTMPGLQIEICAFPIGELLRGTRQTTSCFSLLNFKREAKARQLSVYLKSVNP